ncbi:hypothetical protein [Burkholderia alba]|nr:hypothetical protein [Burkholderia alba]
MDDAMPSAAVYWKPAGKAGDFAVFSMHRGGRVRAKTPREYRRIA